MKCLVESSLSISSSNKHSLQTTVIICESFVNLSSFFFMRLKDEYKRCLLSYSHYRQRIKTNLSLCESIWQSLPIYHSQEQSFSEKFWWKYLFSFCSGFHVQSKASANIINQHARISQGNATHNRSSIALVNISSFFLLSRLSSRRHVQ